MTAKRRSEESAAGEVEDRRSRWARGQIDDALRGLQFGQITVIVQDGVVVQVERTERRRFQRRSSAGS